MAKRPFQAATAPRRGVNLFLASLAAALLTGLIVFAVARRTPSLEWAYLKYELTSLGSDSAHRGDHVNNLQAWAHWRLGGPPSEAYWQWMLRERISRGDYSMFLCPSETP